MFLYVTGLSLFFNGFQKLIVMSHGVVFFMFFFGALSASLIYWLTIFINLDNLIFKFFLLPSYPIPSSWDIDDVNHYFRPLFYKSLSVFFQYFFLSFIFYSFFVVFSSSLIFFPCNFFLQCRHIWCIFHFRNCIFNVSCEILKNRLSTYDDHVFL